MKEVGDLWGVSYTMEILTGNLYNRATDIFREVEEKRGE